MLKDYYKKRGKPKRLGNIGNVEYTLPLNYNHRDTKEVPTNRKQLWL